MKKVYLLIGFIAAFSIFTFGTTVFANDFGLRDTARAAKLDTYGDSVPTIVGNVIGTLLSMISVLFFVLVLYGGILWMTARGSSETTEKALNTIIAATIGIIIVMGAYALTNFVFKLGGNAGGGSPISGTVACCIKSGGSTCMNLPSGTLEGSSILFDPPYECIDTSESSCSAVSECTNITTSGTDGSGGSTTVVGTCTARGETICGSFSSRLACETYSTGPPFMGDNFGCEWNIVGPNAPNCVVKQEQIDSCEEMIESQCLNPGNEIRCQWGG